MTTVSKGAEAVRVVDYEPRHREAFRMLNLEWIETWFTVEEADRRVLDDPEGTILSGGGCILIAERGGQAVGCCALIRVASDAFELAKMAVAPGARGQGIGAMLGRAAIERAGDLGARRLELLSNSALQPALRLYRRLGFMEAPVKGSEYARADVCMVLELGPSRDQVGPVRKDALP